MKFCQPYHSVTCTKCGSTYLWRTWLPPWLNRIGEQIWDAWHEVRSREDRQ